MKIPCALFPVPRFPFSVPRSPSPVPRSHSPAPPSSLYRSPSTTLSRRCFLEPTSAFLGIELSCTRCRLRETNSLKTHKMNCPQCKNGVLEEVEKLSFKCSKCGLILRPPADESSKEISPAAQDENKSITGLSSAQEVLDSNVVSDRTVSTAGKLALLQLTYILNIKEI